MPETRNNGCPAVSVGPPGDQPIPADTTTPARSLAAATPPACPTAPPRYPARQPRLATPRGWLGRSLCAPDPYGAGPPGTDLVHKVDLCCGRHRFGRLRARCRGAGTLTKQTRSCPGHAPIRAGGELTVGLVSVSGPHPRRSPQTAALTRPRSGSHRDATTARTTPRLGGFSPRKGREAARVRISAPPSGAPFDGQRSGPLRASRRAWSGLDDARPAARTPGRGLGQLMPCPRSRHLVPGPDTFALAPCSAPKSPPTGSVLDRCTKPGGAETHRNHRRAEITCLGTPVPVYAPGNCPAGGVRTSGLEEAAS